MHHLIKRSLFVLLSTAVALSAKADPAETTQLTLVRTAQNGLQVQSQLLKNAYRQEPYQDNYTVQVPYQDTETYYVDVPYQDQEPYQDTETYYTNDYVCHNVTDWQRQCHTERQCDHNLSANLDMTSRPRPPGTGPEPFPPGGNGGGGPHPGPITPGPRPEPPHPQPPRCYDRQVCNNVPVTRQQCGYEQTAHTRVVTRYRTVTRYRQEARTRTVTRYRDEQRCCVTKYNTVFDHQWGLLVQVQFPQGTELLANESESFTLQLAGTEASPDVVLTPASTVFGYQIASKTVNQGQAVIVLQEVPRYKASDLQQSTIQSFQVVPSATGVSYSFLDNALFPRVSSTQQLLILDAVTHEVIATSEIAPIIQRQTQLSLAAPLDAAKIYEAVLKIHREGVVLDQAVDFEIHQPLTLQVDVASLQDDGRISALISGQQAMAQLSFKDNTLPYASVVTNYTITVARKNSAGKTVSIGAKSFARLGLTLGADGSFVMPLSAIVSADDLQNYVTSGQRILVVVEVRRQTQDGSKIQFWKDNWVNIQ